MTGRLLALLPLLLVAQPARAQDDGPPAAPVAVPAVPPEALVQRIGDRLGGEFKAGALPSRTAPAGERQSAALGWLDEVFAPLSAPECAPVLASFGIAPGGSSAPGLLLAVDRPVAAPPGADPLLLPEQLAPQGPDEAEYLRTTGLLPFEIALGGEYARVVAGRHAGPAPRDGMLRLVRAARLEGVARLAGIALALRGLDVDLADVGAAALATDHDRAGIPRALSGKVARDPVRAALLRVFHDDGLRWALFHYLRGGFSAVAGALERPAASPDTLLRPGLSRREPAQAPAGCRLGARASVALLTRDGDAAGWVDGVVADRWSLDPDRRPRVWLAFESEHAAARALTALAAEAVEAQQEGAILRARPTRQGGESPAPRGKPSP